MKQVAVSLQEVTGIVDSHVRPGRACRMRPGITPELKFAFNKEYAANCSCSRTSECLTTSLPKERSRAGAPLPCTQLPGGAADQAT